MAAARDKTILELPASAWWFDGQNVIVNINKFIRSMPCVQDAIPGEINSYMTNESQSLKSHYCDLSTVVKTMKKYWLRSDDKYRNTEISQMIHELSRIAEKTHVIDTSRICVFSNGHSLILVGPRSADGNAEIETWPLDGFGPDEIDMIYNSISNPSLYGATTDIVVRQLHLFYSQLEMWVVISNNDYDYEFMLNATHYALEYYMSMIG